jgi:hypothetical protein
MPLSLDPLGTFSVFATVVPNPPTFAAGMGRAVLRLLGFGPAGQPSRRTVAVPPRHELGPLPNSVTAALDLFLFQVSGPPGPGRHLWRPIRSWAWTSRRSARCATASG